eukprot:scaffold132238_cov39-Phaeocystis_antarctica.AAC.1
MPRRASPPFLAERRARHIAAVAATAAAATIIVATTIPVATAILVATAHRLACRAARAIAPIYLSL